MSCGGISHCLKTGEQKCLVYAAAQKFQGNLRLGVSRRKHVRHDHEMIALINYRLIKGISNPLVAQGGVCEGRVIARHAIAC
jgi:hypothetical protein